MNDKKTCEKHILCKSSINITHIHIHVHTYIYIHAHTHTQTAQVKKTIKFDCIRLILSFRCAMLMHYASKKFSPLFILLRESWSRHHVQWRSRVQAGLNSSLKTNETNVKKSNKTFVKRLFSRAVRQKIAFVK